KTGSDGAGFDIARRLGHTIVEPTPALAPLLLNGDDLHRELSGVAQDVELAIWIDGCVDVRLRGAVLWTHFGRSCPDAMDASRHGRRALLDGHCVRVAGDFRRGARFDDADGDWMRQAVDHPRAWVQTGLGTMMPASAAAALLHRLGIDGGEALAHFSR